jgi:hypothetical protein
MVGKVPKPIVPTSMTTIRMPAMIFAQRFAALFNTRDRTIMAKGISIMMAPASKNPCDSTFPHFPPDILAGFPPIDEYRDKYN